MKLINKIIFVLSLIGITSLCMANDPAVTISANPAEITIVPGTIDPQAIIVTVTAQVDGAEPQFQGTEQPLSTLPELSLTKDNCKDITLNKGGTCTLNYTYTPSSAAAVGVQTIGVNDISTVGLLSPTTTTITFNKSTPTVMFTNSPDVNFTMITGSPSTIGLLNYAVLNNTTSPVIINSLSGLQAGMQIVDLPTTGNSCFTNHTGIVLAAGATCNIELSYDGSSNDVPNFMYSLNINNMGSVISPVVNIHTKTAALPVLNAFPANVPLDAEFLMPNNIDFGVYGIASGMAAIYSKPLNIDMVAPPQLGHILFANDGVFNKSFSLVGNSFFGSTTSVIAPTICGQQAECSSVAMLINHAPTTINYDGQYYSDGQSLYKSSTDQALATNNLLLTSAYQIDGLRVIYNANGNPQTYYVTEHNATGGVLMIGTLDVNNTIKFQQAQGLNLPVATNNPANTAIPGMKIYVDSSGKHIIIEQAGAQYVYISANGGLTWQAINVSDVVQAQGKQTTTDLSVSTLTDGRTILFIGGEYSLAYSLDFGSSWVNLAHTVYPSIKGVSSVVGIDGNVSMMLSFTTPASGITGGVYTMTLF